MWQQIIAAVIVIAAAVYVARALGPRRWRWRRRSAGSTANGQCGCGKDEGGCH